MDKKETKKLSNYAYGGIEGKKYTPYVSSGSKLGGGTAILIIGLILAALFAASTAYSGMKSGLTVAAGIPGAIIGSALVQAFSKKKGILSKNLIQGMSSGGECVASGMIFVLPSILLIGSDITFVEGLIAGLGGVLFGIGMSAIVQNYLIVEEHGKLMFPESMAISETLVASEGAGDSVKYMGVGFGIGGFITLFTSSFLNLANNVISFTQETFFKWKFAVEANPLLLGIGFIVGIDVSLAMFAGSIFANFGVMPLIGYFADLSEGTATVWNDASVMISQMGVSEISGSYLKYIGAGMMISGGIIGAIKLIPTIGTSIKETFGAKNNSGAGQSGFGKAVLFSGIILALVTGFIAATGNVIMAILGALLSIVLSLLFVIVSGRITGTIGTSNLPVSGMTIASLVVVTIMFVALGWINPEDNKALLLFGTFIVTAISMAGGYSQSQKGSFVVGGSKDEMQKYYVIAAALGVVIVTGVIILLRSQLSLTGDAVPFALPQANLIATLTSGIFSGKLPWVMVIVGIVMGIVFFALKLPVMTVAIGFYLPISTTSIILLGALLRVLVEKTAKSNEEKEYKVSSGISLSSGLVAGGSIIGLVGIIFQVSGLVGGNELTGFCASNSMAFIMLGVLIIASAIPIFKAKQK